MRARLSVLPVVCHGRGGDGHAQGTKSRTSRPGCAGWQLRSTNAPTAPEPHRAHPDRPAVSGGSSGAQTPRPPRVVPAVPGGSFRSTTAPKSPQTTPPKIVSNAHPGAPGDTLSPGEGILHHFTHPRGSDGEFSAAGGQLRERKNSGFDPKGDASMFQLNNVAIWVKIYILDKWIKRQNTTIWRGIWII